MQTNHGWFDVQEVEPDVIMIAEPGHFQNVKSYLVKGTERVAVLDTGMGIGDFYSVAAAQSDLEPVVLLSHAHFDHIGHAYKFEQILVHPAEAGSLRAGYSNQQYQPHLQPGQFRGVPLPDAFDPANANIPPAEPTGELHEGDVIDLGGRSLEVFHTPGHSPGGITLIDRSARLMFPGDAVYEAPMYARLSGSDPVAYRDTFRKLVMLLPLVDRIYTSHDRVPLSPGDLRSYHEAFEEVWAGRPPDRQRPDRDEYDFGVFSFYLPPNWSPRQQKERHR